MKKIQVISSKENNLQILLSSDAYPNKRAEVNLIAQAKININLDVLGKRKDKHHELQSIMQSIALHDQLQILIKAPTKLQNTSQITVYNSNPILEDNQSNLAYLAAKLFLDSYSLMANIEIFINKKIPIAAGLAGGSTNAAAVLKTLATVFNQEESRSLFLGKRSQAISQNDLLILAEKIGADVPFCLLQGTALCKGKGEIMYPLISFANKPLVIYNPSLPILTKDAFANLNCAFYQYENNDIDQIISNYNQILKSDYNNFNSYFKNDFSKYIIDKYPQLKNILAAFSQSGAAFTSFTGSGPSTFAFYDSYSSRDKAFTELLEKEFPGKFIATYTADARY